MSRFVMGSEVPTENFDWGSAGMRCAPPTTGCESFVVMDVRLDPPPDEREPRTAKSCGPGAATLASIRPLCGPGNGGKKGRSPGRARSKP